MWRRSLIMAAAVLACGSAAHVGAAHGETTLTSKEQAAARKAYVSKCAKCHRFYEPKKYDDAQWQRWMDSMSQKSKLKADQQRLLTRYLDEYRAGRIQKTH